MQNNPKTWKYPIIYLMKKITNFEIFNPIKMNFFVTSKHQITLQYIKKSKVKKK
jgi:hypothetical protein